MTIEIKHDDKITDEEGVYVQVIIYIYNINRIFFSILDHARIDFPQATLILVNLISIHFQALVTF